MLPIQPQTSAAQAARESQDPRARLRARRAKLQKASTRLFVLPGYDSDNPEMNGLQLVARYRRLGSKELLDLFTSEKIEADEVGTNAQFLIEACDEILIRDANGLQRPVEGHKTTFVLNLETNESFGTLVGVEQEASIKDQMIAGFGDNDLVLNEHSGEVHRWMHAANTADDETALGEA